MLFEFPPHWAGGNRYSPWPVAWPVAGQGGMEDGRRQGGTAAGIDSQGATVEREHTTDELIC